jgi:hypothetical protein
MKGKNGIANKFQLFFKLTVEMLQKEFRSLCNFSFLKIVKVGPTNKVQSFFSLERDPFSAR